MLRWLRRHGRQWRVVVINMVLHVAERVAAVTGLLHYHMVVMKEREVVCIVEVVVVVSVVQFLLIVNDNDGMVILVA